VGAQEFSDSFLGFGSVSSAAFRPTLTTECGQTYDVRKVDTKELTTDIQQPKKRSGVDLKPFSSSNYISILLSHCTFGTIVVLEENFVTLKITELN